MIFDRTRADLVALEATADDLSRQVYCILGVPIDAVEMASVLRRVEAAAVGAAPFLLSTPNLNFLVNSQSDIEFRDSLLSSDLCPADGMPIVWIALLLGIPIKKRISGSDIFDALKVRRVSGRTLKVFLFGGAEGVAEAACRALNAQQGGLCCVGSFNPGFRSVDEMSRDDTINIINTSGADFLVASLGAKKGQSWLLRNHCRFVIPIRAHLGAAINFQAGTIGRSPLLMRKLGLEWLWRIKEEPYLWRRYWNDGTVLLTLLFTRILPLAILMRWLLYRSERRGEDLVVTQTHSDDSITVSLFGPASAGHIDKVIPVFRAAIASNKRLTIDFSNTRAIDSRFLGLLLMLKKSLRRNETCPILLGLSPRLNRIFRLNGLGFLLSPNKS